MVRSFLKAVFPFLSLLAGTTAIAQAPIHSTLVEEAGHGITALQGWYTPATGLYRTTGWWNSANAITVLADYSRIARTQAYYPIFANTLKQAQTTFPGFINDYYDDEGWWALAWIDVYDLTHDRDYLRQASYIFEDMTGGWDETCGGGIWWSKERDYKNAIANELFLSVAAYLAVRSEGAERAAFLDWAQKDRAWFTGSGMINSQGLVNDGLTTATCKNNGRTTWTYNQGVILGGLTAMNTVAADPALMEQAASIADAAITHLSDTKGVLHDSCEPDCGSDGVQFKGIFVRNLTALQSAAPKPFYQRFERTNAQSVWKNAQGPNCELGQVWSGPYNSATAASQTSALDAIIAAAQDTP